MAVLAHAALPAEKVRFVAVAVLPLLVVLALEEHLHARIDDALADEAFPEKEKTKRVNTLH